MAVDCSPPSQDAGPDGVCRLYTPAMLAELVGVPSSAIRRWLRQGILQADHTVQRLPYFDFQEAAVAQRLAQLLNNGCSLRTIDRRLAELARKAPQLDRPLADPAVVIEGTRLYLRRGDDLTEPGGQLLLDFDAEAAVDEDEDGDDSSAAIISFHLRSDDDDSPSTRRVEAAADSHQALLDQLRRDAQDWEDEGRLDRAAEAYRTLLMAGGPTAETHFALADLLYRAGELSAARERYYAALELDDKYVEARANLGCVLAELGDLELAAATFVGALAIHPDFADAHFHLAQVLERQGRTADAVDHYRQFLALAPESPWAATARDRIAAGSPR